MAAATSGTVGRWGLLDVDADRGVPALGDDPLRGIELRERAGSAAVRDRVTASTAEFHTHRISQRPAFVLEDPIGDKAVFSGLVAAAPLAATIDAMLADTRAYASYAAHHGKPPG